MSSSARSRRLAARRRQSRTNLAAYAHARRGNTIVLVTGILVLLVIIATAYVSRTQAGRGTSSAVQRVELREDVIHEIADSVIDEITGALFVRQLDDRFATPTLPAFPPQVAGTAPASSNHPRYPIQPDAVRYGRDIRYNAANAIIFSHPYNFAPYEVVPWTNWPDRGVGVVTDPKLPPGRGNPASTAGMFSPGVLLGEHNPLGGPGFGDTRWLRDFEPIRFNSLDLNPYPLPDPALPASSSWMPDAFSHWRHMTNIARPDNGWRIVSDISDIGDVNGDQFGELITDMRIPVEQWLTAPPASRDWDAGGSYYTDNNTFMAQWRNWFGLDTGLPQWRDAYVYNPAVGGNNVPGNLYNLADLDGNNIRHADDSGNVRDLPADEFTPRTPRWNVGRVLTDTDGDGWTDSFWFLSPTQIEGGIRQVVGISIIDNCAMLNVNAATKFMRNNGSFAAATNDPPVWRSAETAGLTPADLALVGQGDDTHFGAGDGVASNWNVGFYDNPDHDNAIFDPDLVNNAPNNSINYLLSYDYLPEHWPDHLREVGLPWAAPDVLKTFDRMRYWRSLVSNQHSSSAWGAYEPFTMADELELRMYQGCNYPYIFSRFEQTVQAPTTSPIGRFLRSNVSPGSDGATFQENSEYRDQPSNRMQVLDKRRMLTTYSSSRNDLMPPWLWIKPTQPLPKLDLRRVDMDVLDWPAPGLAPDNIADTPFNNNRRLQDVILSCLRDWRDDNISPGVINYYGVNSASYDRARDLAASYAANILDYRDSDADAPVSPRYDSGGTMLAGGAIQAGSNLQNRFLGMEAQPFLVDVVIGHIYRAATVSPTDINGTPYGNPGYNVVVDQEDRRSTIIVVQIANPFERTIDLSNFELSVYDQKVRLADPNVVDPNRYLHPARDNEPTTAIYYAIKRGHLEDDVNTLPPAPDLEDKWLDFLDIDSNLPANTIVRNVADMVPGGSATTPWNVADRDDYDDPPNSTTYHAVTLARIDDSATSLGGPTVSVVIDRIDRPADHSFREAVRALSDEKPPDLPDPLQHDIFVPGEPYGDDPGPKIELGLNDPDGYTHWIQYVRATRSWGADLDVPTDGVYEPNEKNPRFVFGDKAVIKSTAETTPNGQFVEVGGPTEGGVKYRFQDDPDGVAGPTPQPWFQREYFAPHQSTGDTPVNRKPFFFDLNRDPVTNNILNFPDKGWYSQPGGPDVPPEGAVDLKFPMQMLQKDRDFEQVGELLNVWLYGHRIRTSQIGGPAPVGYLRYEETMTTFSEYMMNLPGSSTHPLVGRDVLVNRLRTQPTSLDGNASIDAGRVIGVDPMPQGGPSPKDARHAAPALPAGLRIFDAFVCDGPGARMEVNAANQLVPYTVDEINERSLLNAAGYNGTGTPAMINVNTAPPEVLRALPHWYRLVHETGHDGAQPTSATLFNAAGQPLVRGGNDLTALLPRVMVPEALWHYRERYNGGRNPGTPIAPGINPTGIGNGDESFGANYQDRTTMFPNAVIRGGRGLACIGEILLLNRPAQAAGGFLKHRTPPFPGGPLEHIYNQYWKHDLGVSNLVATDTAKPFWTPPPGPLSQMSLNISTDREDIGKDCDGDGVLDYRQIELNPSLDTNPQNGALDTCESPTVPYQSFDHVAGDAEEMNMLFAGASNIITTRSDTFTVYLRVRSFRQNTSVVPAVWDATNLDYIVDDSRYVMLVDRSMVNRPGDRPRILYFEKLPN